MVALVVLVSVIVIVGLALVSGEYLLRAMRRKSRKEEIPLDWYRMPGPSVEPIGLLDLDTTFQTQEGRIRVFLRHRKRPHEAPSRGLQAHSLRGIYIPIGIGRCTDKVREHTITFGAP
jgi:hypothetical protein